MTGNKLRKVKIARLAGYFPQYVIKYSANKIGLGQTLFYMISVHQGFKPQQLKPATETQLKLVIFFVINEKRAVIVNDMA